MEPVGNDQSDPPSDPDPMKKPNPADCDADQDDAELNKDELEDDGELDFAQEDELQDAFNPEPIEMVESPEDGLPVPLGERGSHQLALAPSFSHDNLICIADEREYVEVFADELIGRGWLYKRTAASHTDEDSCNGGGWCPPSCDSGRFWVSVRIAAQLGWSPGGERNERRSWPRDKVVFKYGHAFIANEDGPSKESKLWWIPVIPKRERCVHYRRQVFAKRGGPEKGEYGHYDLYRNCLARRSIGGAFLTVKDEAVYACEYRDPPDPDSVAQFLDPPDEQRLKDGPPEEIPLFGIT